jgi:Zn-dependent protease with chaperone function
MNFFEHQQLARRNTRVMVALFAAAVLAIVILIDVAVAAALGDVSPALLLGVTVTVTTVIGAVSLARIRSLAAGGPAIAAMVGARQVEPGRADPLERRLLNVVEEMAIASGVRVPAVYVLDTEPGINAFAAGWDVASAALTVTRGALQTLTRDELQGVVAHEFSHVLNGDMRLNIRMVGVLAGIVALAVAGRILMAGRKRDRMALAGLAAFAIGYVGLFFARLIKASVSRQREFLGDASAVQFTRNPQGIAGALDQMRAPGPGSLLASRHAEDLSHMLFGQGIKVWFGALFNTHPPLEERIRRIAPGFDASAYRQRRSMAAASAVSLPRTQQAISHDGRRGADALAHWGRSASESANLVGVLSAAKMEYAAAMLAAMPAGLREALREPRRAAASLVALLLAPKEEVMQRQLQALAARGHRELAEQARALAAQLSGLDLTLHLPVVDLALPALKAASPDEKMALLSALEAVIRADRRVSLHEFVVLTLVRHQLAPPVPPVRARSVAQLRVEAATLLSLIAHAGTRPDATGQRHAALEAALRAGEQQLRLHATPSTVPGVEAVGRALDELRMLAPLQKSLLVKGLFAAATADGSVRVAEAELLRLVAAVLECPLPPLAGDL